LCNDEGLKVEATSVEVPKSTVTSLEVQESTPKMNVEQSTAQTDAEKLKREEGGTTGPFDQFIPYSKPFILKDSALTVNLGTIGALFPSIKIYY
jgi:hypothetical protein